MASNRKRKEKLWNENRHCYWCGCETLLINDPHIKTPNPRMATLDHLRDRYDPSRWIPNTSNEIRTVLACYQCNHGRGREKTDSLSKEELWARGNGYKLTLNGPKNVFASDPPTFDLSLA